MKRGLTYFEAIDYVGVKRRTFDTQWRPHLVAMSQGTSLIFQLMNLFGGLFLMLNSAYYGAWPSVGLNVVWVIVGTVGLVRARLLSQGQQP